MAQTDNNSLFKGEVESLPKLSLSFKAPKGLALNGNNFSAEEKYSLSNPLSRQYKLKESLPMPIYKPFSKDPMPVQAPDSKTQFYLKVFEPINKAG